MANDLDRRDFLAGLGVTLGGAALGDLAVVGEAAAQDTAKGRIPETPVKFGHITIQSGPGAILGLPSLTGHTLASEEINAAGGLLGRRRIETITADEAAGPDASVKEVKRMKLVEKIDFFSGIIAANNQLAVGPVVEELKLLTIMTEGCIDKLFEVEVPNPHYLFGMTNILSADGVTTALAIAKAWPDVKRIAVINPDYAFGRWFQLHFDAARDKLLPGSRSSRRCGRRSRIPRISPRTSRRPSPPNRTSSSRRCGAACTWPSTSRRWARDCSAARGWPATSTSASCRRRSARITRRAPSPACIPTTTSPTRRPARPRRTNASSRHIRSAGANTHPMPPRPRTPASISSRPPSSARTSRRAAAGRRTTPSSGSWRASASRRRRVLSRSARKMIAPTKT